MIMIKRSVFRIHKPNAWFQFVILRAFYLLILILLFRISSAYLFISVRCRSLLETFYSNKLVSVSTLYDVSDALISEIISGLTSQSSPILNDFSALVHTKWGAILYKLYLRSK